MDTLLTIYFGLCLLLGMCKENGAISCVDNSIMAPLFQRPLEMGADICMTSATKFIAGHSDVTLGVLTCKTKEVSPEEVATISLYL